MQWLVTFAIFAASVIALLMHRIGRDAGGRTDTRYFQAVGYVFAGGIVALSVGIVAEMDIGHPFVMTVGVVSGYLSVAALVLFAYSFPLNREAPASLRAALAALTTVSIALSLRAGAAGAQRSVWMLVLMLPFFGLTLHFIRRNWRETTAPGARIPAIPVTIVQVSLVAPWVVSMVMFGLFREALHRLLPSWLYLLQALCMALVVVGGIGVAILRYHMFEVRVVLAEGVIGTAGAAVFALYVGLAAAPLHALLARQYSPSLAALVVAGAPPVLFHVLMGTLDRTMRSTASAMTGAATGALVIERALGVTATMVDPDAVLAVLTTALTEITGGDVQFVQRGDAVSAGRWPAMPEALIEQCSEGRRFVSREHAPELPPAVVRWMTSHGAALLLPVRRHETLYGALVVRGATVHHAHAAQGALLADHLAVKFELHALYAETARRARELADQRVFLESILESLPVGLAVVNQDMRVRTWNGVLAEATGIPPRDAIGRGYFDELFPGLKNDDTQSVIDALVRDPSRPVQRPSMPTPGRDGFQDVTIATFKNHRGAPEGVLVITQDVTDRVRLQRELAESQRLAALGSFAAAIAHDIRTPLTSILMNVQMLRSHQGLGPDDREHLDIAVDEIGRLSRFVGEILEFARPLRVQSEVVDARDLVDDVLRAQRPAADARGVSIAVEYPTGGDAMVDPSRARRVLANLVDNAVQSSPQGSAVRVRAQTDRGALTLTVEDDGRGIAPEHHAKIFEPFYTTRADGTGLGLAIAQKITRAHGGDLRVESAVDEGARFVATFARVAPCAVAVAS